MPEYTAPGVYVEETTFRAKSIQGVPTGTTAFVGRTLQAPDEPLGLVTSFNDFAWRYGCAQDWTLDGGPDYLALAVRAFFAGGGRRLHVARLEDPTDLAQYEAALQSLLALPDVAVVAAPGAGALPAPLPAKVAAALIRHAESPGALRFAIVDPPPDQSIQAVQDFRAAYDSKHAAIYYPWIVIADPGGGADLTVPPSGFLAGLYARNDVERGVWKAPANMTVTGALSFETDVNKAQQEVLNPLGVNCLRFFEGRGRRVWGARTLSSDPEFKYVNVRRLLTYLEASLQRGLAWAAFEPNAEPLWANVRQVAQDFLYQAWLDGALLGAKPESAYFVQCGLDTMTETDVNNGRMICQVGVSLLRPAEFVIFRIAQLTASAAS